MRLTLRNLLAYMDNNLKPEDAVELGRRIEESEVATNLLKRVRDVMRRLRLAAPTVTGTGPTLDPNTVAEYLDHVLPSDRVPDFEKVCLDPDVPDSDVHLAEVASCHQILSLVLREPAEVDPANRQRMYQLPQVLAGQPAPHPQPTEVPPVAPPPLAGHLSEEDAKSRHRLVVPEYLREPPPVSARRRRWLPVAASLAMAVLVMVIVAAAFHQFEPGSELFTFLGINAPAELAQQPPADPSKTEPVVKPEPAANTAPDTQTATAPAATPAAKPAEPSASADPPAVASPTATTTSPAPLTPVPPAGPELKPATQPVQPPATPASTTPETSSTSAPAAKPASPPGEAVAMSSSPAATTAAAEPSPPASERLGRLLSEKQILLQADAASNSWRRVPSQGFVNTSLRLLALPPFQPLIATMVGDQVNIQLQGGTQVELLPVDAQGAPGLSISFGRLVIRPLGDGKVRVRLRIGSRTGILTLNNAEATVAIAVGRVREAGTNPESQPGPLAAELIAAGGQFVWDDGAGHTSVTVRAPAILAVGGTTSTPITELPKWITTDEASSIDQLAAPVIDSSLQGDRPAELVLQELAGHRKKEVVRLAIRSLGYLGNFEPTLAALNSTDVRSWNECFVFLQEAIDRSPETAADVRRSLERSFTQDAAPMYRMLWGYSDDDLRAREAYILVNTLKHDTLACRVLAFLNLKRLNGGAEYNYKPTDPVNKRSVGWARWNEWREKLPNARPEEKKPSSTPSSVTPPTKPRDL
jgi:hypothetical protein